MEDGYGGENTGEDPTPLETGEASPPFPYASGLK